MALHVEVLPRPSVDTVFLRPQRVCPQQHRYRLTGHCPAPHTHGDVGMRLAKSAYPRREQRSIFTKEMVGMCPEIGAEENNFVGVFFLHGGGTSG